MTTTSASETSQSTESCVSPEDLKQYLSGWYDDADAERIESHLAACPACEQALREFEVKPDTLLQMLQTTTVEKAPIDDNAISHTADEPIDAALAKARKLMDVPIESARSAWQPASKELGVYELLRPLGRGGMGAVYLATHRQLHKQVAIKLLPVMSAEDSDVRARFQREIRVVGKLNHPSIVAATDAGEIDGTQFLVMEYVPGMDLSRLARLLGKLTVSDACELMRQVALGLSCAHAEGVVHRDVKPSNLMLDETGRIRILDFGLAQLSYWDEASIELTSVGQLMGTLDYMAPEQAELSGGVDYRADLYAMGATLFRLLCGRPPLAAAPNQSPLEKLRLLANHQPPKLDTLCPEAPPELVKLMASLLARSPQDRQASAAHVAEELAAFTESADLVTLLKRAEEQEAESPNVIGSDRNRRDFMPAMARSNDAELQDGERGRTGGLTPPRSPRAIGRWITAAMLPLLVVAGILIKLETDKGQLVIESEVTDVKVRITNDGKPVSKLTIKHGTTATRLRADKYEVIIDGPSNGLTIENDQFTLKNGETVVARVRLSADVPIAAQDSIPATKPNEPLYEGKSLDQWLDVFSRERSPTGLKPAFDACSVLVSRQNSEKITQSLLKWLPLLDGELSMPVGSKGATTVDSKAAEVLVKANPGPTYYTMWVKEFEKGEQAWRERLCLEYYRSGIRNNLTSYEPIIEFAERRLSTRPGNNPVENEGNEKLAEVLLDEARDASQNPELVHRVLLTIRDSAYLKRDLWLRSPFSAPVASHDNSTFGTFGVDLMKFPTSVEFKDEVVRHAVETLEDEDSSLSMVAQACMILANGAEINDERRLRILKVIKRRLESTGTKADALTGLVPVSSKFRPLILPGIEVNKPPRRSILIILRLNESPSASPIVEMLDLVDSLKGSASIQNGLSSLVIGVQPTPQMIDARREGNDQQVVLDWPKLTLREPKSSEDVSRRDSLLKHLWGTHEPTSNDWLKYCIIHHPVMEQYLAEHSDDPAVKMTQVEVPEPRRLPPSETTPAKATNEPLYEGKTLDQWLEMLSRERSPAGLKSALEACQSLVSAENAARVTATLMDVLPRLNGDMRITFGDSHDTVDGMASGILRNANPGADFYKMWVNATDQANDDAWKKRLQGFAIQAQPKSSSDLEPLVVWAETRLHEPVAANEATMAESSDAMMAAVLLRGFVAYNQFTNDQPFTERVAGILKSSPHLDQSWWLSQPLIYRVQSEERRLWPAAINNEIVRHAIAALDRAETSPSLVAQACMILANGAELNPEPQSVVVAAVARRLSDASTSPEKLTLMVQTGDEFSTISFPEISQDSPLYFLNIQIQVARSYIRDIPVTETSMTLQLLNLARKLDQGESFNPQLEQVLAATTDTLKIISPQRLKFSQPTPNRGRGGFGGRQPGGFGVELSWPALKSAAPQGPLGFGAGGTNATAVIWGNHEPTATDWHKYLILLHPVMKDTVDAALERSLLPEP